MAARRACASAGSSESQQRAAEGPDPRAAERRHRPRGAKPGPLPAFIEPQLASPRQPCRRPATAGCTRSSSTAIACWPASTAAACGSRPAAGSIGPPSFPRVQKALERLPVVTAFLDGEVVVETERGAPDFAALQARPERGPQRPLLLLPVRPPASRRHGSHAAPRCSTARRALARLLAGRDDGVLSSASTSPSAATSCCKHACRLSLEGIVSKLGDRAYRSGRSEGAGSSRNASTATSSSSSATCRRPRSAAPSARWCSATSTRASSSMPAASARASRPRRPRTCGAGSRRSASTRRPRRAAAAEVRRNVRWAKPSLVAEVEFRGWTADGILRHAVFKGLRQDKQAADVAPEKPAVKSQSAQPRFPSASPIPTASLARRRRDQAGPGRVLRRDLAVDRAARRRPAAGAGALPRRHRGRCFFQKHAWAGIGEHVIQQPRPRRRRGAAGHQGRSRD